MSKIYLELRSGLGNQLFQFAFGYTLSKKYQKQLILCPNYFDNRWKYWLKRLLGREARSFRLSLILPTDILIMSGVQHLEKREPSLVVLDESKADTATIMAACQGNKDIFLKGYWQNPLLFSEYQDAIAALLVPNFKVSQKFKATVELIDDKVVGIHVRRGDFLTNRAFGACTLDYYLRAIKAIEALVEKPTFLIFTNNRKWVETNFPGDIQYEIYSNNLSPNTDLEEMLLMTKLRSLIISNSTFSWWSAFLNRGTLTNIVCPQSWFLSTKLQRQYSNLVVDKWIALPNQLELAAFKSGERK